MRNLARLLKIAATRISRNPYHALAAVSVMFLTFFVSGAFILILFTSQALLSYFESRPAVTAFLKDGTSPERVKGISDSLINTGVVSKTRYVSKEEALKIYKERNKNEPLLTEFVTSDILPASIEVSTYKLEDLAKVATTLKNEQSVEEVVFQKNIVDTLSAWTAGIRNIGGSVIAFLLLTSFFITLIVIGLNISLHQDEIEIMRLVGATKWYVRLPFIFEGIFYGVFSASVASIFLWGVFAYLSPILEKIFSGIPNVPSSPVAFVYILLAEVGLGAFIGVLGSFVATRRYLTV